MQTAVPTRSALQSNVDALGPLNADVGAALQATTPAAVDFAPSADGVEAATYRGRPLCSRHRPRAEAERLASTVDLVDHAVVVVFGFGLGYHVEALAARLGRAGVIIVFEPDVALLRTVLERIDHSRWLRDAMVVVVTDAADRAAVAGKMVGAETLIAQGLAFLEHPPSRERLGDASTRFSALLREFVAASKTTLMTTLIRSVDTVHNLLLNIDHYVGGDGIEDLRDVAPGVPAVVVSAGPSLRRNLHLLAAPGVRERCIIIAVQTTLKPLLAAGIRPHFVTSLDYHEISGRFFEGLAASDVEGVTLVAEAKAHPIVMDLFPGATRCAGSGILDEVLGPLARDMGRIGAGATVAHLAVYLARHLGCSPIAMIGQDLGFTDGLYYAPGTAIHEVWAPELNPFNTIEMMEWQRIVRHRLHLRKTVDLHGRSIYTDLQMVTYLQQFERDFAKYRDEGIEIIDASEGGVRKQHATIMPLAEVLERYATRPVPELPPAAPTLDDARLKAARRRLIDVRHDVEALRENANRTRQVLRDMIRHQADAGRMSSLFRRLASCQAAADRLAPTFRILNHVNQMGAFKRMRADRRIQMAGGTDLERQRAQLERDVENTDWLVDAASELERQLVDADRVLTGARVLRPAAPTPASSGRRTATRVAAVVPVDPERNGLGVRRRLDVPFRGRPVLQATLERLGRSATLDRIILLVPDALDLGPIVDQARIGLPLEIERCGRSPFDGGAPVIAAARRWADTCWRGGIGGMSIYDEVFAPIATGRVLKRLELDGALLVGPDWPLVDVVSAEGCDAVVRRFREQPDRQGLVFTQSPPGLCGCVLSRGLIEELSARSRLATVGGLMVYQPHVPQHDPIARDANVQIDHGVRRSLVRATYDTDRQRALLDRLAALPEEATSADVVAAIEAADASHERSLPQHLIVELCTDRTSVGGASGKWIGPVAERGRLSL
ncbi:MAG: DUF115 domain-containing protein, partial [Phycisphaerales bacterium]|nr:DUF115 domain-containing protein [Phycisphaerales bacterium]